MRRNYVLLMSAAIAACAGAPELRQPVGQTLVASSHVPVAAEDAGAVEVPESAEHYVTGNGAGPCGMDPLPILPFANSSSSVVDEEQKSELRQLASCLTEAPFETTSVVLVGYSDLMGPVPANLALGLERAKSVMRLLIDGGVAPGRIVVASAGELQRPHARWGMRANRVEILVARGGPPRPDEAPITRGIEAEGLLPRKSSVSAAGTPAPSAPTPAPSRGAPSRGAPASRGLVPGAQPARR